MGAPTTRAHYAFRSEQLPCDSLVIDCDMAVVWSVNDVTSKRSSSACTVGASNCNATGLNTFEWSTDLCSWFLLPMRCCASRLLAVALTLSVSMSVCLSVCLWQSVDRALQVMLVFTLTHIILVNCVFASWFWPVYSHWHELRYLQRSYARRFAEVCFVFERSRK